MWKQNSETVECLDWLEINSQLMKRGQFLRSHRANTLKAHYGCCKLVNTGYKRANPSETQCYYI